MLSQALVPLVGLVDATVIGRTGDASSLAGVALGASLINLIFWTFGFLRMGVTGLTAQAVGGAELDEVDQILWRAMAVALAVGLMLSALSPFYLPTALAMFHVPANAALPASQFTGARLFGAPAALGFYVINGWLLGLGRTRTALACQAIFNVANIGLDVLLVAVFDMHALGVGIGTTIAEWLSLAIGLLAVRMVRGPAWLAGVHRTTFRLAPLRRMAGVNANIMVRTIALLLVFAWFARAGARLGTTTLAANHVLLQLVTISAYVLDGFALTAEIRVGMAVGACSRRALRRTIRLVGECSIIGGAAFTALFLIGGKAMVAAITVSGDVRSAAFAMLPLCALVPLIGAPAWLLDGVFIGATRGGLCAMPPSRR